MSKPGIIYRLVFDNVESQEVRVDIKDKSVLIDDGADETITELEISGDGAHVVIEDTDEGKYTPIKTTKAVIKFLNSESINLSTFAAGEDDRFNALVYIDDRVIFDGFLQQGDISEPFLYQENQEVQLTAIDGLAFLKDIPHSDDSGLNPLGIHNIMQYIVWCLHKIGSTKNINVVNNLREEDNPGFWQSQATFSGAPTNTILVPIATLPYFKFGNSLTISGSASNDTTVVIDTVSDIGGGQAEVNLSSGSLTTESSGPTITFTDTSAYGNLYALSLDAKTWEDKLGTCINCYDVLTKILGHDSVLFQARGEWWIVRTTEIRNDFAFYVSVFNHGGIGQSFGAQTFEKAVGLKDTANTPFGGTPDASSRFSQAATTKSLQRPNKYSELTYNYKLPLEIICNIDFSRGDFIENLDDETQYNGDVWQTKSYEIDCWTLRKGAGDTETTPDCDAYIKRNFFNNYETARVVIITLSAVEGNPKNYLESEPVPMGFKDKFTFSLDWSTEVDVSGSPTLNQQVASIWLEGIDGSFYKLLEDNGSGHPAWATTDTSDSFGLNATLIIPIDFSQNTSEYVTKSLDAPELPIPGKVRFRLLGSGSVTGGVDDFSSRFTNVTIDYKPYINGSFEKYTGQSNTATRDGNYKPSISDEVFISNSPERLFKGALLKAELINDAFDFALVDRFYEGQQYLYPADGLSHLASFGELQVRAFHNQNRNSDELYRATCQGIGEGANVAGIDDSPSILHRYFLRDLEPTTNDKTFQLVTQDKNLKSCEWTGTLIKNFDNDTGFVTDDYLFKYETEQS